MMILLDVCLFSFEYVANLGADPLEEQISDLSPSQSSTSRAVKKGQVIVLNTPEQVS